MALQERYFASFHQRVADVPLDVRMHYGHPDVLDKLHFLSRGGISRPSKGVNLNEDVFAAYTTTMRDGAVVFREYMCVGKGRMTNLSEIFHFEVKLAQGAAEQCMSRDVCRLARALALPRLLSFYYSGLGFYIHQVLVMRVTLLIGYLLPLLALLNVDGAVLPRAGAIGFMAAFPLAVTLATILPATSMILAQRGVRATLTYAYRLVATLAPVYYIFLTQARAHFFARTIRYGGSKYFVSTRAVSTTHVPLHEIFSCYARSHFYPAVDVSLILGLGLAPPAARAAYASTTWMVALVAACWLVTPHLYNLQAVEQASLATDVGLLVRWLRAPARAPGGRGAAASAVESWEAWWDASNAAPTQAGWEAPAFHSLAGVFYLYLAAMVQAAASVSFPLLAALAALAALGGAPAVAALSPAPSAAAHGARARAALGCGALALAGVGGLLGAGAASAHALAHAAAVLYLGYAACCCALEVLLVETSALVLRPLRALHRARDVALCVAMLAPLGLLAALWLPARLHGHLLFHQSFFQPTRACHAFYAAGLLALVAAATVAAARALGGVPA
jgi:callose synthase